MNTLLFVALFTAVLVVAIDALPTRRDVVGMTMIDNLLVSRAKPYAGAYKLTFAPYEQAFQVFKKQYAVYYDSDAEEEYRFSVFKNNVQHMEKHNVQYHHGNQTYYQNINHFSDKTLDEYRAHNRLGRYSKASGFRQSMSEFSCDSFVPASGSPDPDYIDWREKGAVTSVKNQGQCGSCWSFSATGSIEGSFAIRSGRLLSLSEQQAVDCCTLDNCHGCNGGTMDMAFEYINQTGGLETEEEYPYTAQEGTCAFEPSETKVRVTGCADVKYGDESILKKAVQRGPVSVAIDANHPEFMRYGGGVYYNEDCSPTELDHGVLVVGYGNQDGQDYWMVKNSWAAGWGMSGYILMARNQDNNCGIASMASFPYTDKP